MLILHEREVCLVGWFFLIAYNRSSDQERQRCAFIYFLPHPSKQIGLGRLLFYSKQKSCSGVTLISRLAAFSLQNVLGELVQIEWFANVSKAKKDPHLSQATMPDLSRPPSEPSLAGHLRYLINKARHIIHRGKTFTERRALKWDKHAVPSLKFATIRAPSTDHLQEKTGKTLTDRLQYSSDSYFAALQIMFAVMSQPKSRPFLNLMLVESPTFPLTPSALKELLTPSSLKTFKLDQTFKRWDQLDLLFSPIKLTTSEISL